MPFLPVTKDEMKKLGWDEADFVFVTGDAYVDHPSFGPAILTRLLESRGYHVAVLAQPDWKNSYDFTRFGKPRLGFLVSAGNLDSMVAHYTAAKRKRHDDAYSPGKKAGLRPDRAVTVYSKKIKSIYPDVPVIIGGIESSLRRFAHYDYWTDRVMPSVLVDSGADLLSFGMGERQTLEIAERLNNGEPVSALRDIRGTCYLVPVNEYEPGPAVECPSFEKVCESKKEYAVATRKQQDEQDHIRGKKVIQRHGKIMLVQNPPAVPLSREELDEVFDLPYMRNYHPMYEKQGGVPAIDEVLFSITHNRGCFGGCNFCALAFHQGRFVTSRSKESILREANILINDPRFKGYIHDVGGPSADFRRPACEKQLKYGLCPGKKCLAPTPCPNLIADHSEYLEILRELRSLPKVKAVFIRSGIRYDYVLADKDDSFFKDLVKYHVSGHLKVAPEHCSTPVLDYMGKPHIVAYVKFQNRFMELTRSAKKEQYLVPYLMSSHPGSTIKDAVAVAQFLKKNGIRPEQVQDFYPTPGTVSTCMFYTGLDPYTMKEVYVPVSQEEKAMQRALLQYYVPENADTVRKALHKAHRDDLIGSGENCLVREDFRMKNIAEKNGRYFPKNSGKNKKANNRAKKAKRG
ncbi:MAG: YgiQ family radical SAM protein [Oscillospiraceae bacterium]